MYVLLCGQYLQLPVFIIYHLVFTMTDMDLTVVSPLSLSFVCEIQFFFKQTHYTI